MKLIIDIPKEKYDIYKEYANDVDINTIIVAVANGTPYEERSHGEWNILQKDDNGVHKIECPFCKYFMGGKFCTFHELPYFCECCGAKLRGDANEKS